MITEKGLLQIGVEYEGKLHKEFEIRPQLVRDSIEAVEIDRARSNESFLGLVVLSKQIQKLGDISKDQITPDLLMDMQNIDLQKITLAQGRMLKRQKSFRGKNNAGKKDDSGND